MARSQVERRSVVGGGITCPNEDAVDDLCLLTRNEEGGENSRNGRQREYCIGIRAGSRSAQAFCDISHQSGPCGTRLAEISDHAASGPSGWYIVSLLYCDWATALVCEPFGRWHTIDWHINNDRAYSCNAPGTKMAVLVRAPSELFAGSNYAHLSGRLWLHRRYRGTASRLYFTGRDFAGNYSHHVLDNYSLDRPEAFMVIGSICQASPPIKRDCREDRLFKSRED